MQELDMDEIQEIRRKNKELEQDLEAKNTLADNLEKAYSEKKDLYKAAINENESLKS